MRSLFGAWVLAAPLIAAGPLAAQDDTTFSAEDVFALEYADDPRISPDGRTVLFVRRSNDIMSDRTEGAIWMVPVDGGEPRLVVDGASQAEWSPDGRRIVYSGRDSNDRAAIYTRWMDSGQVQQVASLDSGASSLAWSPDGQWIAFTSNVDAERKPLAKMPKKPEGAKWSDAVKVIEVMEEVRNAGAIGSDTLEQQVAAELLKRYADSALVPVGSRWARTPLRVQEAARENDLPELADDTQAAASSKPSPKVLLVMGLLALVFVAVLLPRLFGGGSSKESEMEANQNRF